MYDGRQREFRGFRRVEVKQLGDANSPSSISSSEFLLGECKDEEPADSIDPCSVENRWRDNPREALKGLPTRSEIYDERGVFLSTTHHTYRLRRLYVGLDGREVRHAFQSATDIWTYDTAAFVPSSGTVSATDVELELALAECDPTAAEPSCPATIDTVVTIPVRSTAGRAHVRSETIVDAFGNATAKTAFGCLEGCPAGGDERIDQVTLADRPEGDSTGWLWRTVESWVSGSAHRQKRQHQKMAYSSAGDLIHTSAELWGTLPLDRRHKDPAKAVAPPPNDASDGVEGPEWIDAMTTGVDLFGNVSTQSGPNCRFRSLAYDDDYAQLVTEEAVAAGYQAGGCGTTMLPSTAEYDRGLGIVTFVRGLHDEPTRIDYDGSGRLSALTRSSPELVRGAPVLSTLPSVLIEYFLPTDWKAQPYSIIRTRTQDGISHKDAEYQETYGYVDGLGRSIVTLAQADPSAGDAAPWIANGLTEYDAKGAPRRAYLAWFYSGNPQAFPLSMVPPTRYGRQRYDAFGRQIETYGLDGTVTLRSAYHALSEDKWDAADLAPGPHQGTYASAASDGHGRPAVLTERVHVGRAIEERQTITTYLPSGEAETIRRRRVGKSDPDVVRWMRYDSLGRRVLNVEPSTSVGFHADPHTDPDSIRAWRYAYNDAGDLVGTSDARGCGANCAYDAAGRLIAEDYSPCDPHHEDYSQPDLATGTGVEVLYHYDEYAGTSLPSEEQFPVASNLYLGRLVWVADRASKTVTRFDALGRVTGVARQIARPGPSANAISMRYAPEWYIRSAFFDAADRPIRESTGAEVDDLLGLGNPGERSVIETSYSKRGTVKQVGGSYGELVASISREADGLVNEIVYGDAAHTTTGFTYDGRRRLRSVQTYRGPPSSWTTSGLTYSPAPNFGGSPSTFQLLLQDQDFRYDAVDNPIEIRDWRIADEWPDGAKPVTRKLKYDDLYRVTQVDYQYSVGADDWTSPFEAENQGDDDPRRAKPSPHVAFDKRVLRQSFQYDWLGNTEFTGDDANGFYDRSLGTIQNDGYRLEDASNIGTGTRDGKLDAAYDAVGNLVGLSVLRNGNCLPVGAHCSQRFAYGWDEVGRLVHARRWDISGDPGLASGPLPLDDPAAELHYAYDANDARVIKTAVDLAGAERHTLYIFATLELRRSAWNAGDNAYTRDALTEVPYLIANGVRLGRVVFEPADKKVPSIDDGHLHVFFELGDHLGSTNMVLDKATSELVELSTFQAYGATDSDYRPERWKGFREDYRFTGKEEDVEVGLVYFGARYYAPQLGRWISADPLAVHVPGEADLNLYAYVHGRALIAIDPLGLEATLFQGFLESVKSGDFSPGSPFGQALSHADYVGSSVLQNDKTLKTAQDAALGVSIAAGSVATGGAGAKAAATLIGTQGLRAAVISDAAGGVSAGAFARFQGKLAAGGSVPDALEAAADLKAAFVDSVPVGAMASGVARGLKKPHPGGAPAPNRAQPGAASKGEETVTSRAAQGSPSGPGATIDPTTGHPVGRFIVDPKGNTMLEPAGGTTVGNPQGPFVETRFPNGSPAQQLHGPHRTVPYSHGHGFKPGTGVNQRGPSLDPHGTEVPAESPAAHWPVKP